MLNQKLFNYIKKIGFAGFLFFLIKGIVWIFVFYFSGKVISTSMPHNKSKVMLSSYKVEIKSEKGSFHHGFILFTYDSIKNMAIISNYANQYLKDNTDHNFIVSQNNCSFLKKEIVNTDTLPELKAKGYFVKTN